MDNEGVDEEGIGGKIDGYFFENEVKVDGQTVFTIPIENQFFD